jgi:hypothetical protein
METLYFLMSRNSVRGSTDWDWSLTKVKVSDTESAYVAAATKELAASLAELLPETMRPQVVAKAKLPPKCYRDFSSTRVLLIDTAETLARYRAERSSTFPYGRHIVSCQ